MLLWKLAVRNLRRNRRRSLITLVGIALGLGLMAASNTLATGSRREILQTGVSMLAGHVVVQAEGYQADPDPKRVLADSGPVAAALREAFPDGVVTRRLLVDGLMTSPSGTTAAAVRGVDLDGEAAVTFFDEKVSEGAWLTPEDKQGILLGDAMARTLGVGLGDKVVFMAQPEGGEVESRLFRVRGLLHTGTAELDGFIAVAPIAATQALYRTADAATQVAVHLEGEPPDAVVDQAKAKVGAAGREVLGWRDAIPELVGFIDLDEQQNDVIWLVLGVIVALGVVNTVLMSVLERVREFGIMLAVGLRPRRLAAMVLTEGFVLGLVSALVGMVVGLLFSWPLVTHGVDFSAEMGESMEAGGVPVSMKVKGAIDWTRFFVYPFVGVLLALLASVYPAWRVATLTPVEAIRHR